MAKRSKNKVAESKIVEMMEILDSGEENRSHEKVEAFFRGMPEEERRQFAAPIVKFCRERQNWRSGISRASIQNIEIDKIRQVMQNSHNVLEHWGKIAKGLWWALLAVAIPKEIEKCVREVARFPFFQPDHTEGALFRILGDRKPDWLESFLLEQFEKSSSLDDLWNEYRKFYHAGLVSRLLTPHVILGLFTYYKWFNRGTRENPVCPDIDDLRKENELLDQEIWLMIEQPMPVLRFYIPPGENERWYDFLTTLVTEGHLSRERLIDSVLSGLIKDDTEWHEKWLLGLYDRLKVDTEEQFERLHQFIEILNSSRFPKNQFAIEKLLPFAKNNRMDDSDIANILAALPPLLRDSSKGRVKKTLTLLEWMLKNSKKQHKEIIALLLNALIHENTDIQETAAKLLIKYADCNDSETILQLQDILPSLSASVKKLFSDDIFSTKTVEKQSIAKPTSAIVREHAQPLVPNKLPEQFAKLVAIPELLEALQNNTAQIASVIFNGFDIPRLYPEHRIQPIESIEELIDASLRFLITSFSAFDMLSFERIIDGIARLHEQCDDDFEHRIRPLQSQIAQTPWCFAGMEIIQAFAAEKIEKDGIRFFQNQDGSSIGTSNIILPNCDNSSTAYGIWCNFVDDIMRQMLQCGSFQPLATPTHARGWVDPVVFVQRLIDNRASLSHHGFFDKTIALLRLAPDHRTEALHILDSANLEADGYIDTVRYALGAEQLQITPNESDWTQAPLWAAASRGRNPFAVDEYVEQHFPQLGFGTTRPVTCSEILKLEINWSEKPFFKQSYFTEFSEPFAPLKNQRYYPSILLYDPPLNIRKFHFLTDMWPGNTAVQAMFGLVLLAEGMNSNSYAEDKTHPLLSLLDPDLPIGDEAMTLLAVGLLCSATEVNTLAKDVTIITMRDGRFDVERFSEAVKRLLPMADKIEIPEELQSHHQLRAHGEINDFRLVPSRWSKSLTFVASESPLHAMLVHQILEKIIPLLPSKDLGAFLELLYELEVETAEMPTQELHDFLKSQKGTGKAAKLSKKLLELKSNEPLQHEKRHAAITLALQHRIDRIKRWSERQRVL